jgi:GNAT superfamily N-acetyltransferase
VEILKRIQILRADSNQIVDAEIIRLTTDMAREKIDKVWWILSNVLAEDMNLEGDFHWDWERLARFYIDKSLHECVAVLSQENYLEGAMVYQFNAKSKLEPNKGIVYVGWLASAPRNRNWLVKQPFYKGVGTMLLYWAIRESYDAGLGGRISLQSLPTPSTVQFYKNKGLVRTDLSQPANDLVDYELPESAALTWLQKQGDLP